MGFSPRFTRLIKHWKGILHQEDEDNNLALTDFVPTKPYVALRPPLAFLQFEHGELEDIPIWPGFLIGRATNCHLTVADQSASRVHAGLVLQNNSWLIQDLGSTNGTTVNGDKILSFPLTSGDRIQIGLTVLVYKER